MKIIGWTATIVTSLVVSAVLNGYALSILWRWFIVPVFHAPPLAIPEAIGIGLMVEYLTHQVSADNDDDKTFSQRMAYGIPMAIFKPLWVLAIGWVVHLFI